MNTLNFNCKIAFNTFADAVKAGYIKSGEIMLQVGYISRVKFNENTAPVYRAGKGKRAGQLFYLAPNSVSTRFCKRVYLKKAGAENE